LLKKLTTISLTSGLNSRPLGETTKIKRRVTLIYCVLFQKTNL